MRVTLNQQDVTAVLIQEDWVQLSVNGAINPSLAAAYMFTKAGVLAMTLAAPVVTLDDGKTIKMSSNTANAHTVTTAGLLKTGTASINTATFAALAGAGFVIEAFQGFWMVISSVAITFS